MKRLACAVAALAVVSGCGAWLTSVDDPEYLRDAAKLSDCRNLGRDVADDAGADAGWAAYVACKKDAGF